MSEISDRPFLRIMLLKEDGEIPQKNTCNHT